MNPEYIEEEKKRYLSVPQPPKKIRERLIIAYGRFNAGKRLKTISTPTLIIHGKKDQIIPYQNAEVLAKMIPCAKLASIENAGHNIFAQEPEKVNKIINEFLK